MFDGELVGGKSTGASEKQNRRCESVSSVTFFSASKQLGILLLLSVVYFHTPTFCQNANCLTRARQPQSLTISYDLHN